VPTLRVTYLEQRKRPLPPPVHAGGERIGLESLTTGIYLALYQRVGESLRWDQRLLMPREELAALLQGESLHIYVLRDEAGQALGFCEFYRGEFPEIELKNFGLIPEAQGHGLGPWLLSVALQAEWRSDPTRIWLHTDTWDHPAAVRVYERAGFHVYAVREEALGPL
jgi:ribosomal protein S18 acetylase RimI-like enzyme